MSHIDEIEAILEELTSESIIQSRITSGTGIWLYPSLIAQSIDYNEKYFYVIKIISESASNLETLITKFLKCRTNIDFNYNDFNMRGSILSSNGSDFALDDDIVGTTSGATGTIYKIDDETLYLKDITGIWEVEAINGKTATCLSTKTTILFPHYLNVNKLEEFFDDYDNPIKEYVSLFRFEGSWSL